MESQTSLYAPNYREARTYGWALAFVAGNIILPQLCHLIPQGGLIFLPIYFFTFVGAYKYGWRVGLLVALLSPVVNSALFGMPPVSMLPVILFKSVLLAVAAGLVAAHYHKATLPLLLAVILFYQIVGGAFEWLLSGDWTVALQDWRLGYPGMLLQLFGGWFCINRLFK